MSRVVKAAEAGSYLCEMKISARHAAQRVGKLGMIAMDAII
jgi:hypothetical protein